jgi:hypothetical protein
VTNKDDPVPMPDLPPFDPANPDWNRINFYEGYMLALQRVTGHVHFYGESRYGMDTVQKREFCLQLEKWRPYDHPSVFERYRPGVKER